MEEAQLKKGHLRITDGKGNGESNYRIRNGNAVGDGAGRNRGHRTYLQDRTKSRSQARSEEVILSFEVDRLVTSAIG